MYSRDPPLSNIVDSISKCCIFIYYQLKTFQNFKHIFLKINFFNSTTSNVHNSAKNKARDLLLVSFCREFYLVWPHGLNSKPTTWYLFIWTHTYELFQSKTLNFVPLLGPYFSPQIGWTWKLMADSYSASPKILKFMYKLYQSNLSNSPFLGCWIQICYYFSSPPHLEAKIEPPKKGVNLKKFYWNNLYTNFNIFGDAESESAIIFHIWPI